ncbi:MAG TPA: glycosyltransferase family 87 protein [Candidatus Binatia bacterium]|jgi:hypothetical protein|nr:glycosyltransferase family 87 protein [Candidatus Binatia bacterium]
MDTFIHSTVWRYGLPAQPFYLADAARFLPTVLGTKKLWAIYSTTARKSYLPWLAVFTFIPTWMVLIMGNISPLILLGIVGFLHFEKKSELFLAGVSTALISVKPRLFYLFWIGLILWIWKRRRWPVAFGAMIAGSIVAAIPAIIDPAVYSQFFEMYSKSRPHNPLRVAGTEPRQFTNALHTPQQCVDSVPTTACRNVMVFVALAAP